jgi:sensor histidine kinase YesM
MTFFHQLEEGETMMEKYFVSLIYCIVYWNGAFFLFMYFRRRFPLIRQTTIRLIFTFIAFFSFLVLADPFLCSIFHNETLAEAFSWAKISENLVSTSIASLIIGSFYENAYYFDQWKNSIRINESLKNQQIRTQFEVLQNQMSPHFLFNSLNTLTTLIAENQKTAIDFTEKLSEVYRYILQNREKELVSLKDELDFVRSYVFLLQMRYPENLSVDFSIDERHLKQSIPPLTLQILVENAIKHNAISKAHPLKIDIYVDNGKSVVVRNNLQLKKTIEKSTKTGLSNIRKRYQYFGKRNIDIINTATNFLVAAPLLDLSNESDQLYNLMAHEGSDY